MLKFIYKFISLARLQKETTIKNQESGSDSEPEMNELNEIE